MRTQRRGKDVARIVTGLAVAVALVATVSIPATYFAIAWTSHRAALRTEAEINARLVNDLIGANPEMWKYEELRLGELLSRRPDARTPEQRTVYDADGVVVARTNDRLVPPFTTVSHVLRDSGRPVGRLEIVRSLRPVIFGTGAAALFGLSLGFAVFFTLRMLPMSALRNALASLSREKERAQATLQSIREGVVMADRDGNVVLLNSAAERITGWALADAAGRPLGEVVRVKDAPAAGRSGEPASGRGSSGDAAYAVLVPRGGTERLIEESTAPILDGDGPPAGSVHVIRDVTEKVRQDEELLKARKMESLGILAGGIAHDFNNLLTGVVGNISLAKLDATGEALRRRLDEAEKASGRAKELASRLLAFSRGGLPIRKLIALDDILRDSAVLATSGTGAVCEFRVPEGLWPAEADAGQLSQVVNNLVMNAVQAMPNGGTVTVEARNESVGEGEIPNVAPGDYVRISVEDRGVGIPPDCLQRIFDPYFTTKPGGNGLGLTSCYHIVKSHGGNIFAESEPGGRTVFRVYLPASTGRRRPDGPGEKGTIVRGKGRVLVMDDDDLVRSVADGMLGHLGYDSALASDGAEAVAMYSRAADSGEPFDAVILDLTVHGGMGGKEAIGKLRDLDAGVRAIVSSGYSSDPVMADYRAHGFAGVVAKPYRIEELSKVLDGVVRGDARSHS